MSKVHVRIFFLCCFCFTATKIQAQQVGTGSWNILHAQYHHSDKWSFFGEGQIRSLKLYNHFHYYELKGGIHYQMSKTMKFSLAAGTYQTYKEGGDFIRPKNNDEFRLWPQIIFLQNENALKIEQRYRAELRFTTKGFRNRFRYRFGLSHALNKQSKRPLIVSANNELFFTDVPPYFERNRMTVALNFKPNKHNNFQMGYVHQFDYKINDETGKNFFMIGYFLDVFRK